MNDPIIAVEHLSYRYQAGKEAHLALDDVSFTIARGSCAAIIGVTGSGKSTLVQHFNGLLRPGTGTVRVAGIAVEERGGDLQTLRQRVGMLFQFPESQLFAATMFADVAFGPQRLGLSPPVIVERVRAALDTVGLPYQIYEQRSPFALSGGQMRRAALAGVLAMQPAVLVLDEPTVGLDAAARSEFYGYLQRARAASGLTIVIVSHDMAEVASLADQVLVLHAGRLVADQSPRALFADARLREWGLAPPPLGALLDRLRAGGVAIPPETTTLDAAFALLRTRRRRRRGA